MFNTGEIPRGIIDIGLMVLIGLFAIASILFIALEVVPGTVHIPPRTRDHPLVFPNAAQSHPKTSESTPSPTPSPTPKVPVRGSQPRTGPSGGRPSGPTVIIIKPGPTVTISVPPIRIPPIKLPTVPPVKLPPLPLPTTLPPVPPLPSTKPIVITIPPLPPIHIPPLDFPHKV